MQSDIVCFLISRLLHFACTGNVIIWNFSSAIQYKKTDELSSILRKSPLSMFSFFSYLITMYETMKTHLLVSQYNMYHDEDGERSFSVDQSQLK